MSKVKDMEQLVYFDIEDELRDGNGWNVIALNDDDSIAIRFITQQDAEKWCVENDFLFRLKAQLKKEDKGEDYD
jgi:hypothetical protein